MRNGWRMLIIKNKGHGKGVGRGTMIVDGLPCPGGTLRGQS